MAEVKLAPSILAADFARLGAQVAEAEAAGADYLHIDPMDGHFVDNLTFGPMIAEAVHRSCSLPLDVHLMVEQPERYIDAYKRAGAEFFTVHAEACTHLHRVIHLIRNAGLRPGVAINPATPLERVRWVLPDLDLLLVMSIDPGWGGQKFLPLALDKLREAGELVGRMHLSIELEVDGGVDEQTAPAAVAAGATMLVAGSAIFSHPDGIAAATDRLRRSLRAATG